MGNSAAGDEAGAGTIWFSVAEACKYLAISQPTLFRWMKQGLVSFYKVGGATRFSKEGLDALVEKTTGLKEAEAAAGRCSSCGHGILVEGDMQGASKLYFRPARTRFWVMEEALVPTKARVCAACGYVHLHVDTAKLKRLSPKDGTPGEGDQGPAKEGR